MLGNLSATAIALIGWLRCALEDGRTLRCLPVTLTGSEINDMLSFVRKLAAEVGVVLLRFDHGVRHVTSLHAIILTLITRHVKVIITEHLVLATIFDQAVDDARAK